MNKASRNHPALDHEIFSLSPFPMWIYDLDTLEFLKVNKEAINCYGYSEEEFLTMTILEIRPNSEIPKLKKALKQLKENNLPQEHGIFRHRKKNGDILDVLIKGNIIFFNGRRSEIITAIDQTEKNRLISDLTLKNSLLDFIGKLNGLFLSSSCFEDVLRNINMELKSFFSPSSIFYYEKTLEEKNKSVYSIKDVVHFSTAKPPLHGELKVENKSDVFSIGKMEFLKKLVPPGQTHNGHLENSILIPIELHGKLFSFLVLYASKTREDTSDNYYDFIQTIGKKLSIFAEKWDLLDSLKNQKDKFRKLIQESADIICILNPDSTYKYVSPNVKLILGYSYNDLLGKKPSEFIHPSDSENLLNEFEAIKTTGTYKLSPYRIKDKSGNYLWVRTILTNMLEDPLINGIVANSFEINLLKAQQEEIEMVNERYRLAALASKDLIYDMDLENDKATIMGKGLEKVFDFNANTSFSYSSAFWEGKIHPEDREKVLWRQKQYLNNQSEKRLTLNYRFKKANEQYAHVIDSCSVIRNSTGKAIRLIGTIRDITKIKQQTLVDNIKFQIVNDIVQTQSLKKSLNNSLERILRSHEQLTHAEVWMKSNDNTSLHLFASLTKRFPNKTVYTLDQPIKDLKKGKGLPGRVWESLSYEIWKDLPSHPEFLRKELSKDSLGKHALGIPVVFNNEFLGVILCFTDLEKNILSELVEYLYDLVEWIGPALKNKIIQEELSIFLQVSSDLLVVLSPGGKIIKVNKAFSDLTGLEPRELLKKNFMTLFKDPTDKNIREIIARKGKTSIVSSIISTKEDEEQWIEWNKNYDSQNNIIYLTGRNITEKRKQDHHLQLAFNKLNKAQRIAKLGYWSRKLEEDISEWTEETYKIHGYSPDNFIPTYRNVLNTFHPKDRHLMENADLNQLMQCKTSSFVHRIITANDEIRWVAQHINLVNDEKGNPYMIEGVIQDITDLKVTEEKLKTSIERFELAMKATKELIWDIDLDKGQIFRSKAFEEKIHYCFHEKFQFQNSWQNIVDASDRERIWKSFMLVCSNRDKNFWKEEYKVWSKQGGYIHVIDRCYILRDNNGMPYRTVGAIQDVTESKKQMGLIKYQNDKLKEIAWQQSHEVRAPLSRILALINYYEEFKETEKVEDIMDLIKDSSNELDKIIRTISDKTYLLNEYINNES